VPRSYSELELDALRELASIGSGTAATALSRLLGREIELQVPRALALGLADAVDAAGPADMPVASAVLPVGGVEAVVLLLFSEAEAAALCELLGVEARTEVGDSALAEICNILGASALGAVARMTGVPLEPRPPQVLHDMLGAVVASALAETSGEVDVALVLDTELRVEGVAAGISFLLLPTADGAAELLERLGLGR
jgi:chemotaxis protein CheC